jgi:hypothetical protein
MTLNFLMQEIQLNIIPFSPTVTKLEVGLFKEKTEGYTSLHKGEYPKELCEQYESQLKEISHLYCNFYPTKNAEGLIDQVYKFSRIQIYWKCRSQQNLQVTTKYPEMVERIYPHFQEDNLPEFGKSNLWFL